MKKILDKLKDYFKVNKKLFLFLSILLVIGVISGSIFSITISKSDSEVVNTYLKNYISSIGNNEINLLDSFLSNSISNLLIIIIIWLMGLSVIGIPIVFIIFFYKSFIFGFTVGSILINYKVKGILLSIIYMFPHQIINLIVLMTLVIYSYIVSSKLLKALLKKDKIDFSSITHTYSLILGITILITLIFTAYASFIVSKLIKIIIPLLS